MTPYTVVGHVHDRLNPGWDRSVIDSKGDSAYGRATSVSRMCESFQTDGRSYCYKTFVRTDLAFVTHSPTHSLVCQYAVFPFISAGSYTSCSSSCSKYRCSLRQCQWKHLCWLPYVKLANSGSRGIKLMDAGWGDCCSRYGW